MSWPPQKRFDDLAASMVRRAVVRAASDKKDNLLLSWTFLRVMRPLATAIFGFLISLSPGALSQPLTAAEDHIRRNYRPLDPANPEHAVIIAWHKAILANDYEGWRRIAPRTSIEAGHASREEFRKLRATTPKKIFITPKPSHTNPNGSHDWGLAGCGKPEYFDPPYKEGLILPDHPISLGRMATTHFEAGRWVVFFPEDLFLPADPDPCDDSRIFSVK